MRDAQFWSQMAPRYAARPISDMQAYDTTIALVRAHLHPTDEVLEVGCGTGTTALRLADAAGHITATDYAPGMIQIAQAKLTPSAPQNVSFTLAAVGTPLGARQYDVVMGFNLLHLIPDLHQTIATLGKSLRPGGLFITKSPCMGGRWRILQPVIGAMRLVGKAPYVNLFTPAVLEAAFRAQGYTILETGDYPKHPPTRLVIARKG